MMSLNSGIFTFVIIVISFIVFLMDVQEGKKVAFYLSAGRLTK